jgi:hypothetical protein
MTASGKRLAVLEPAPALGPFLADHVEGWDVLSFPSLAHLGTMGRLNALILADDSDHRSAAAVARKANVIGPIFSLGEQGAGEASGPFIALSKPLRLSELSGRLDTPNGAAIDGVLLGKWRIESSQRQLVDTTDSHVERLTDKEFEVLSALLIAMPEPLSREQLQAAIWRYHSETSSHTVETHIWRLRQKIENDPAQPELLKTVTDGYMVELE